MNHSPPTHSKQTDQPPAAPEKRRRSHSLLLRLCLYTALVALAFGGSIALLMKSRPQIEAWALTGVETALLNAIRPQVSFNGPLEWQIQPTPVISVHQVSVHDEGEHIAQIERITIRLDPLTLRAGILTIDAIEIVQPEINLGHNPAQWFSAKAWLREVDTTSDTSLPVVIRRIDIHDASALAQLPAYTLGVQLLNSHLQILLESSLEADFKLHGLIEAPGLSPSATAHLALQGKLSLKDDSLLTGDIAVTLKPAPSTEHTWLPRVSLEASVDVDMAEQQGSMGFEGHIDATLAQGRLVWNGQPRPVPSALSDQLVPLALVLELDRIDLDEWEQRIGELQTLNIAGQKTPDDDETASETHQAGAEADLPSSEPTSPAPWADWPIRADIRIQTLEKSPLLAHDVRIRINHPED